MVTSCAESSDLFLIFGCTNDLQLLLEPFHFTLLFLMENRPFALVDHRINFWLTQKQFAFETFCYYELKEPIKIRVGNL